MDFFFRKKDERKEQENKPRKQISLTGRPYNDYSDRDASIKLWVPESIKKAVDEVCSFLDTSASDFIRQVLFVHMYGRVDFLGLIQMKHPSAVNSHISSGVLYSISTGAAGANTTSEKNTASYKIWVPAKMKADLDRLATHKKMSLSEYARKVIIIHLLGHLPHDNTAFSQEPPRGIDEG